MADRDPPSRPDATERRRQVFWHELSAPISTVRSLLEVMADGSAGEAPPGLRDLLERCRRQAARASELIGAAHDLERLRAGTLAFADAPVDLAEVLREAGAALADAAARRHLRLEVLALAGCVTRLDPRQLGRCAQTLLRAALELARAEARVEAEALCAGGRVALEVRLSALAEPGALPAAAEPTSLVGLRGGPGLGLHEARLLVEAMGGRLQLAAAGEAAALSMSFPVR